jgi:hypothetical protein
MFYKTQNHGAKKMSEGLFPSDIFFYIKLLTTAAALVVDFDPADLLRLKD